MAHPYACSVASNLRHLSPMPLGHFHSSHSASSHAFYLMKTTRSFLGLHQRDVGGGGGGEGEERAEGVYNRIKQTWS